MKKKSTGIKRFINQKSLMSFLLKAAALGCFIFVFIGNYRFSSETKVATPPEKKKMMDVSQTMGHHLGKTISSLPVSFKVDQVVQVIKNSTDGKEPPLSEIQWNKELANLHEEQAKLQKQETEDTLKENAENDEIAEIIPQKLQYKVLQEGGGETVRSHFRPQIRYSGRFLDGTVFLAPEEATIQLDETILGLQKGIEGMKQGEKRLIYVHPELGFQNDPYFSKNELLIFDVELLDINTVTSSKSPLEELLTSDEESSENAKKR